MNFLTDSGETQFLSDSQNTYDDSLLLQVALDDKERQLANLISNAPGGVHQCKNDDAFTLLSMSNGFLSMFGYTQEEIETQFQNQFLQMVHPHDREALISRLKDQLTGGNEVDLEYRVRCKDGSFVWVLDKSHLIDDERGSSHFYCILLEITAWKQQQEELRLNLERYQVIFDQATDIIFEWDMRHDRLIFSSNWKKKFGYDAISEQVSTQIPLSGNIHRDDMPIFLKLMAETAAGVPYNEGEFRIRNLDDSYLWCRVRITPQFSGQKRPIKAIGVIIDIDSEKRQKQALIDQAQRDTLTGLYNKATINALVDQHMKKRTDEGYEALMIIDIDHFKDVNDTYGHLCGDSLLASAATVLKNIVLTKGLVGRIGGDEFLIYLSDVTDETSIENLAQSILCALHTITPDKGEPPITCSIGVAFSTAGICDYLTLFKHADQALYLKKKNGRCGFEFYETELATENISASAIGSMEDDMAGATFAQYAFKTLYKTRDIESSVNSLIEIIGNSYDVCRVYIFESSEDGSTCSNTFEWCADGIESQIKNLQNLSYLENLGDYCRNFSTDGVFYCNDITTLHPDLYGILKPQGICSMLQCAMMDEGEFRGYIGFDECRENRLWTKRQVASFKLTADVVSEFIVKLRLKQKYCPEYKKA